MLRATENKEFKKSVAGGELCHHLQAYLAFWHSACRCAPLDAMSFGGDVKLPSPN